MNFRRIIAVNRNLGFFTTGYNWLVQIIPALLIAPLFIQGKVEFGVITQSAIAFTQLLGAFSIIVNQFSPFLYTAVFRDWVRWPRPAKKENGRGGSVPSPVRRGGWFTQAYRSPRSGRILVKDLSVTIPQVIVFWFRGRMRPPRCTFLGGRLGTWPRAHRPASA
jgi:putative ATP-binding cassette transporter